MNALDKSELIRSVAMSSGCMARVRAAQNMPSEGYFEEEFKATPFSVLIRGSWGLDLKGKTAVEFHEIIVGDEAEIEIIPAYESYYSQQIIDRIEAKA